MKSRTVSLFVVGTLLAYGILLLVVILIVIIFGPKNLVRQNPAEAIAQANAHAMSD